MRLLSTLRSLTLHDSAAYLVYFLPIGLAFSRALGDVALSLVAVLFLFHCAMQRDWRWLKEPWLLFALAFWVYAMAIGLGADRPDKAIMRALLWVRYPLFAIAVAYWVCHAPHFTRRLLTTVGASVVFLIVDTAIQYINHVDLLGREAILPGTDSARLTGPYSSQRIGISLLWIGMPFIIYVLYTSLHPIMSVKRLVCGTVLLAAFCATIFISGERMALLFTALGLFLSVLLVPGKLRFIGIGAICTALALMFALSSTNPNLTGRQIGQTKAVIAVFMDSHYARIWGSAAQIIEENPLFGVGLRHFREECPKAKYGPMMGDPSASRCNRHPHNMYFELITETGIIGMGLWLAMIFLWGRDGLHALARNRTDFLLLGLLILLFIRLWPIASTTSMFISWSAVPFWFAIGWLYSIIRKQT